MEIAICAIGYNRIDSLSRLLFSLNMAHYDEDVTLIISLDRCDDLSIKKFSDNFLWNHGRKIVVLQNHNLGLRKHILRCGQYMIEYGFDSLVVLEDDVTVSPYFFSYVKKCLSLYANDELIAGISLYNFPINYITRNPFTPLFTDSDVFLMNCAMSWGQVWTKNKWEKFIDWYNKNSDDFSLPNLPDPINNWPKSSWLKYHTRYCIENNLYFIYPYVSLSTNNSDPGMHNNDNNTYMQANITCLYQTEWRLPKVEDIKVLYDGFFEPKHVCDFVSVDHTQLCVNLNGSKKNTTMRYELTMIPQPYKVVRSYGLRYKPIEANVILNVEGNDIFLYDRYVAGNTPKGIKKHMCLEYYYLNIFEKFYVWRNLKKLLYNFVKFHYAHMIK